MRNFFSSIAVLFALVLSLQAGASERECTRLEAFAAEAVTDYLDSWGNVYAFFKQFRHCYDGAIAEGAQDRVHLLWVRQWRQLSKMVSFAQKDPEFKAFLSQILESETFPQAEFAIVAQNARWRCPPEAREFCQAVLNEAAKMTPNPSFNRTR